MTNLDILEQKVEDLASSNSIFRYREISADIESAVTTTTNAQRERLLGIVNDFRVKIPNLVTYKRILANANDIAHILLLASLDERIDRIKARNDAITRLTTALQREIDKGNNDATLLKRIKEGVDKATETVTTIRDLINQLTDTETSIKDKLEALVKTLDGLSSIFA